jgi:Domain of Unknown Function with PDB structure (DUF3857)
MLLRVTKAACLLLLLTSFVASAQKDEKKYRKESEDLRAAIWGWQRPEFAVRTIPAEFANASSVIMARHIDINADSHKKTSFIGLGFAVYRELMLNQVIREMVKINDKTALQTYSEINYTQLEKKGGRLAGKTTSVFVGVRVIKPDGSVKEINADDIVLTKDEKKTKEAKVAVPDLQVGDIIDYYIASATTMTSQGIPPYTFPLFDESPIMHYSIHCEVGKKYAVEYRGYNGAPDFKRTAGEDDGNVLDMQKENIPACRDLNLWVLPYRQLPIIRMNILVGTGSSMFGMASTARKPGEMYRNPEPDKFIQGEAYLIGAMKSAPAQISFGDLYDSYKQLKKNNVPPDSLAAHLFYMYRFQHLLDFDGTEHLESVLNLGDRELNPSQYMFQFSQFLTYCGIDNKLVLATSHYGPDMKGIMGSGDINYMVEVDGQKQRLFGITDAFTPAFYVPSHFEYTRKAVTLNTRSLRTVLPRDFDQGTIDIPGSSAEANIHIEKLEVNPVLEQSALQLKRTTTLRGHYKADVQQALILFEDYYDYERKQFGYQQSVIEQLHDKRGTRKYGDELAAAFQQARKHQKESFQEEVKEWFGADPSDLTAFGIDNLGVRHNSPDFKYHSSFMLPNTIKKAGNNYIIDVGKLEGTPLKIEDDQRNRTLDVYSPFARSLQYDIEVQVPDGFSAEGLANLNRKVENECGLFTAEASLNGKTVLIHVRKVYKNTAESAANWPKMLAFIDAANDWTNAKLLLKKNG